MIYLKTTQHLDELLNEDGYLLLYFYKEHNVSKKFSEILSDVDCLHNDIKTIQINESNFDNIFTLYNVETSPTLIFIKDKNVIDYKTGFIDIISIQQWCEDVKIKPCYT